MKNKDITHELVERATTMRKASTPEESPGITDAAVPTKLKAIPDQLCLKNFPDVN